MKTKRDIQEQVKKEHDVLREVFFKSEKGRLAFTILLDRLCHFRMPNNEHDEHLRSFATELLNLMCEGNSYQYVEAISKIENRSIREANNE